MGSRRFTVRRLAQLVAAAAVLPLLYGLDLRLSQRGSIGWERRAVSGGLAKFGERPSATGVVILGSSTTRDWMGMAWLANLYQYPVTEIVDGHINGCHQGCTWAETRRLIAAGRHFDSAIYGLNHFQMCEHRHSKRVLQHRLVLPRGQTLDLWSMYTHAKQPQWYLARSLVAALSDTLADTAALQAKLREQTLGKPLRGRSHRWVSPHRPARERVRYCTYNDDDVRYKLTLTAALFDDLQKLANTSQVLILPDQSLSQDDPAIQQAWERHRAALTELAATRPWIELIDLTDGGPWTAERFTDGVHLGRREYQRQRQQFGRQLYQFWRKRNSR